MRIYRITSNMRKTKIIAMYLPQYHCIPENDAFWGKGFTDWVTVKKAKPLYKGHIQPRVPINDNYYDLSLEDNVVWQAKLAEKAGIYGFGVYHYWFNNEKNLLTKPAEIIRDSDEININYFLAWDNASWVRSWTNVSGNAWSPVADKGLKKSGPSIMVQYELGEEADWKNHFGHILSHFKNPRYIKVDGKPMFVIFNYNEEVGRMCSFWNRLAKNEGFSGIYFVIKYKPGQKISKGLQQFKYEPLHSGWSKPSLWNRIEDKINRTFDVRLRLRRYSYDQIWKTILCNAEFDVSPNILHGAFVSYDDTPRRGRDGRVVCGASPEKFQMYLDRLMEISSNQDKEFVFVTAWNEWGEGAYLEPDTVNGYSFLESLSNLSQ